jgi:predicted RNA-binding Zn ribbon-like protein
MTEREVADLELCGNVLCLDFANTVTSRRHATAYDYIATYPALRRWLEHAGAPDPHVPVARRAAVLRAAHQLRDAVYRTFSAVAGGRPVPVADLAYVGDAYGDAVSHATIAPADGGGFVLRQAGPRAETPLWTVALSAGDLLLAGDHDRLGECPGCGWLFLDTSRNHTRRWCSMATCGSRDKMARHYRRSRA